MAATWKEGFGAAEDLVLFIWPIEFLQQMVIVQVEISHEVVVTAAVVAVVVGSVGRRRCCLAVWWD